MRPEDIDGLTVGGLLDLVTERRPDHEALVYADRNLRYTYPEFKAIVENCARSLMALGIQKGDHVAVWGQNVPEGVILQFATGKAGAVLVTINPAYKSHELKYVLEQSDAAAAKREMEFHLQELIDHNLLVMRRAESGVAMRELTAEELAYEA